MKFPVDEQALKMVRESLDSCYTVNDEGEPVLARGDFTLNDLLEFYSGYDPEDYTPLGMHPSPFGDDLVEWRMHNQPIFHEHDVIRALIDEVERLRAEAQK